MKQARNARAISLGVRRIGFFELSVACSFSGVSIVGDADANIGGLVDWQNFPGACELKLLAADGDGNAFIGSALDVINAPSSFTINFQNANFNGSDVGVAAVSPNSTLTLDFASISNSDGSFLGFNESAVNINASVAFHEFFGTSFDVQNVGIAPTLTINTGSGHGAMIGADTINDGANTPGRCIPVFWQPDLRR